MSTRKTLDAQASGLMVLFCLCLGMQQVALKATGGDIAPVLQIALRSGAGALLVGLVMWWQRERLSFADGNWRPGLLVGLLFAAEYFFLGEALRFTSASHAVIFLYTSPIFSALILHFRVSAERMGAVQWSGILLAFAGIALAFLAQESGDEDVVSDVLLGDVLALLGGLCWGITTVVIRSSSLSEISPRQTLLYQLVAGFVLLLIGAAVSNQLAFNPTPLALASLGFQSVIVSFGAFMIWFWLLRHYVASQVGVLSFMTPLFGVALGGWLLDEPITPGFLFGSLLVIAGLLLVSGQGWFRQRFLARRPAVDEA
ncbi:DMT family transporter [Marinobacter sp. JSM 1782161]|uniref:DMT family transporter n=1 Tax=Marinobacter sp. JSM 1782161 TaxID=2685906 RepID=UPI0014023181|nr:DMT family transporter [Marinobacter sp. JSM 1782161]